MLPKLINKDKFLIEIKTLFTSIDITKELLEQKLHRFEITENTQNQIYELNQLVQELANLIENIKSIKNIEEKHDIR